MSFLDVEDLPWSEARGRFTGRWYELLVEGDHHLSLAPEWLEILSRAHGRLEPLRLCVVRDGEAIVGLLPYCLRRERMHGVPVTFLELGGNAGAYHNALLAPGREEEVLRACLHHRRRDWHVLFAHAVETDGPTARALRAVGSAGVIEHAGESSPYLSIRTDWTEYLKDKSGNFRSNLKRKEKALRKEGRFEERWYTGPENAADLVAILLDIEAHCWKVEAGVAVTQHDHETGYYRELIPWLAEEGHLLANVLFVDDVAVAYHLCTHWNGKVTNLKTSFREGSSRKGSPGAVVIARAVERAFAEGAREFDFLGGAQHHKLLWTDDVRPQANLYLFSRHLRSRALAFVKKTAHRLRGGPAGHEDTVQRSEAIRSGTE